MVTEECLSLRVAGSPCQWLFRNFLLEAFRFTQAPWPVTDRCPSGFGRDQFPFTHGMSVVGISCRLLFPSEPFGTSHVSVLVAFGGIGAHLVYLGDHLCRTALRRLAKQAEDAAMGKARFGGISLVSPPRIAGRTESMAVSWSRRVGVR